MVLMSVIAAVALFSSFQTHTQEFEIFVTRELEQLSEKVEHLQRTDDTFSADIVALKTALDYVHKDLSDLHGDLQNLHIDFNNQSTHLASISARLDLLLTHTSQSGTHGPMKIDR